MKSWLAQGSSGRRVTLLTGATFLHLNGALLDSIKLQVTRARRDCDVYHSAEP